MKWCGRLVLGFKDETAEPKRSRSNTHVTHACPITGIITERIKVNMIVFLSVFNPLKI